LALSLPAWKRTIPTSERFHVYLGTRANYSPLRSLSGKRLWPSLCLYWATLSQYR